jgi:hypothetical protein
MKVTVTKAEGVKCPRCWKITGEGRWNFDGLCDPCCHVIITDFPTHEAVPQILASRRVQKEHWCVS